MDVVEEARRRPDGPMKFEPIGQRDPEGVGWFWSYGAVGARMIEHDDGRPVRHTHVENEGRLLPVVGWQVGCPYGSSDYRPTLHLTDQELATGALPLAVRLGTVLVDPTLHLLGSVITHSGVRVAGLDLDDGTFTVRIEDGVAWLAVTPAAADELGAVHEVGQPEPGRNLAGAILHGLAMRRDGFLGFHSRTFAASPTKIVRVGGTAKEPHEICNRRTSKVESTLDDVVRIRRHVSSSSAGEENLGLSLEVPGDRSGRFLPD
jgi:hypothetical protein